MPPTTRSLSRLLNLGGTTDDTSTNDASSFGMAQSPSKPLKPHKGRKRFAADLAELKENPRLVAAQEWSVKSVKAGDEEGSFEITLVHVIDRTTQTVNLVVSDTSEYPEEHTYFGYSQDGGALQTDIARAIDKLPQKTGHTLLEISDFFVAAISRKETTEEESGNEDYEEFDVDDMIIDEDLLEQSFLGGSPSRRAEISLFALKKDFVGVKAAGYNPGIYWTELDRFILSISFSVIDLHKLIPPHALIAWDQHFLEPGQHLTLLISGLAGTYPILQQDGTLHPDAFRSGTALRFKVGFSKQYKPSSTSAMATFRQFITPKIDKPGPEDGSESDSEQTDLDIEEDPTSFTRMTLSASLESLLDQQLLRLLQYRRKFDISWAAAEELLWQVETTQEDPASIFRLKKKVLEQADKDEKKLSASYNLPKDPIDPRGSEMNLMKIAFVLLLRRLTLSTRHCVICHKKLGTDGSLRPYVCDSGLCTFQYYSLNMGPSIEHEILSNPGTVDLLVSIAYVAAAENVLDEPLPRGMGLRVQPPKASIKGDDDKLCNFDTLDVTDMRIAIKMLLDSLPSVQDMKDYLLRQFASGNMKARLKDMAPDVLPAAWSVLRWCVASCTAYIQEITNPEDRVRNIGTKYRQFRFMVGAPDKEAKFQSSVPRGHYKSVFAFHGSPLRNWHSIIRHGLWFKTVAHGRSHGNGVYFATEANVSLGSYAQPTSTVWKNSTVRPIACCAIAEIANRTSEFVYANEIHVHETRVARISPWKNSRYLLVSCSNRSTDDASWGYSVNQTPIAQEGPKMGEYLTQDSTRKIFMGNTPVEVPKPSYQLDKRVQACAKERKAITLEPEDRQVVDAPDEPAKPLENKATSGKDKNETSTRGKAAKGGKPWKSNERWILRNAKELLPPPTESSTAATTALQREFRSMMREQNASEEANDLGTLGWHLPPQHNDDNLYQWLVELHSFDPELPLAKDMKAKGVNSIVMEIRFPSTFPHSPPFFRVIRPRFKPFVQGGGGHVTVGGSVCMDLLTSDGWLPSYCISAVLLQIRLAISSTNPYPARLQDNWDQVYTPDEAYSGYVRAAGIHKWKINNLREVEQLVKRR